MIKNKNNKQIIEIQIKKRIGNNDITILKLEEEENKMGLLSYNEIIKRRFEKGRKWIESRNLDNNKKTVIIIKKGVYLKKKRKIKSSSSNINNNEDERDNNQEN